MEESVFAIPADDLWNIIPGKEKGFIEGNNDLLKIIVTKGFFGRRGELEEDPSFKQVISYGVLSNIDSYFLFKRGAGQKEKRLHGHLTLGAGGHMNPSGKAVQNEQYFIDELKRELSEELRFSDGCSIKSIEFAGFLNDDTIEVGRHHIGLLYNIRLTNRAVSILETEKLSGLWVNKQHLMDYYDLMETWSQFIVDEIINKPV